MKAIFNSLNYVNNLREKGENDIEFLRRLLLEGRILPDHLLQAREVGKKGLKECLEGMGLTITVRASSEVEPLPPNALREKFR